MPRILRSSTCSVPTTRRLLATALSIASLAATAVPRAAQAQRPTTIPTPESVFGFPIGKDSNLVDYEQSID